MVHKRKLLCYARVIAITFSLSGISDVAYSVNAFESSSSIRGGSTSTKRNPSSRAIGSRSDSSSVLASRHAFTNARVVELRQHYDESISYDYLQWSNGYTVKTRFDESFLKEFPYTVPVPKSWAFRNVVHIQENLQQANNMVRAAAENMDVGRWALRTMDDFQYQVERAAYSYSVFLDSAIGSRNGHWIFDVDADEGLKAAATTMVENLSSDELSNNRNVFVRTKEDWECKMKRIKSIVASFVSGVLVWKNRNFFNDRDVRYNFIRDSGLFRLLVDSIATISVPTLAIKQPWIVGEFLKLTFSKQSIRYDKASSAQKLDMYLPHENNDAPPRGLVFFVHGGAWGSGLPWMYRLVAKPFLEKGLAVAVVGYRTYPSGDAMTQVEDLELAARELNKRYPKLCQGESELGVNVVGHSSGAHIGMLMIAERIRKHKKNLKRSHKNGNNFITTYEDLLSDDHDTEVPIDPFTMRIDKFIGLSGIYDINSHFDFETSRGLEELSPMKAACGCNKKMFRHHSPSLRISDVFTDYSDAEIRRSLDSALPVMALVHGADDDTVPVTSTSEAANLLRCSGVSKCDEIYLSETGHSEPIFDLMFGGKTQDAVVDWLERSPIRMSSLSSPARTNNNPHNYGEYSIHDDKVNTVIVAKKQREERAKQNLLELKHPVSQEAF